MKIKILLAAALLVATASAAEATTFNFLFDGSGGGLDGTIGAPIVGTGTFTTPEILTPGVYALSSLPSYSMNYSFEYGASLSTADIATPIDGVALDVTAFGAGLRLTWTEAPESLDADQGPFSGSLDLLDYATLSVLSFEPSSSGGDNLYFEASVPAEERIEGNYLATSVPEPAGWTMMILGFAALGGMMRRRREMGTVS